MEKGVGFWDSRVQTVDTFSSIFAVSFSVSRAPTLNSNFYRRRLLGRGTVTPVFLTHLPPIPGWHTPKVVISVLYRQKLSTQFTARVQSISSIYELHQFCRAEPKQIGCIVLQLYLENPTTEELRCAGPLFAKWHIKTRFGKAIEPTPYNEDRDTVIRL